MFNLSYLFLVISIDLPLCYIKNIYDNIYKIDQGGFTKALSFLFLMRLYFVLPNLLALLKLPL